jgi:DNA-directed RNA polymerase specialized sigma24 family protein
MKEWQKDRNYRKFRRADGSFTYVISVDGERVEVSKEIYEAYSQEDRRARYLDECDEGRVLSIECMADGNAILEYFTVRRVESAEDAALRKMLVNRTMSAIATLSPDDKRLIYALAIMGVTEKRYADLTGVSQAAVHKRKKRVFKKIFDLVGY